MNGLYTAYISVGSNIGDKLEFCKRGIRELNEIPNCRVTAVSRFYRTAPVDYMDQDWFVNAAAQVETRIEPADLLNRIFEIEHRAGRVRGPQRFGPRTLDMDILIYADQIIESAALTIPHPRLHLRRFVLQPLCDMEPDLIHPVIRKSMAQLLSESPEDQQVIAISADVKDRIA